MPKISIITPVYCDISDKVDWLSEMVQSVVGQTLTDWEIILINDKSPLPLDPVKMKYATEDRLRWFENAKNDGPAKTRNTAVALAESDCILALDSDDMLADNETLEYMYDAWIMDQTKIIYGNLQMYKLAGSNIFQRGRVVELGQYTFELAMNLNGIMPVTAMHSKECHYQAGGWKDALRPGLEDVEYWIASGKQGFCGQKIDHTTLVYRQQQTSRAYKLKFVDQNFEAMQHKIREMHSDIYIEERFPMSCCGKGNNQSVVSDPIVISQQSQSKQVKHITTLAERGYDFREDDIEWVAYQGPKKASAGSILTRDSGGLPNNYPIMGKGHLFQIHKSQRWLFEQRQRLGFQMNQPDPRQQPELEPEIQPVVEIAPQVIEMPAPEMSTIVSLDTIAAQTRQADVQEIQNPAIVSTDFMDEDTFFGPDEPKLSELNLSKGLTETLKENSFTVSSLAHTTSQMLSSLPGIGIVRANSIIAKAQELINKQ